MSAALRLYSLLMWLGQPLLRRKLARRSQQEPGYAIATDERFGHYTQPREDASQLVWVHAVSLGETRAAAILLKALRARYPQLRILLTHGTATGRAEGKSLLRDGDVQVWQPWDSSAAAARFFDHFKPRLGLLMETEVWPNAVAAAQARSIPLVLVNARLSEKSLRQALRLGALSRPTYAALSSVHAQTEGDAERFRKLGVEPAGVFGNLKFDATPSVDQQAMGRQWREGLGQPVLLLASSRDGEEKLFLEQIMAAAQAAPAHTAIEFVADGQRDAPERLAGSLPRFLLVPRHPQRFDEVEALAIALGLRVSRRSSWPGRPAESEDALRADVWLGDSLGEMAMYYSLADVALLGGSFAPLGGQNLIEAAACGCPVVMGPHTFNFAEAADMAEASGAAQRVASLPDAMRAAQSLLGHPSRLADAASAARIFAQRNKGATGKTVAALNLFLGG